MRTYVSFRRTVSKSYQSRTHEFGFDVEVEAKPGGAARVHRAQALCEAVVNAALGEKIGKTRKQLNEMAVEFFGGTWQELSTGVAQGDEEL